MITPRFTPYDADRAVAEWGANCGPMSLAIACGLTLEEVRPHFTAAGFKSATNPTLMMDVLRRIRGDRWHLRRANGAAIFWARRGIARIQWGGRWMRPEVPAVVRYKHTHWVASSVSADGYIWIWDCNVMETGWVGVSDWNRVVVPALTAEHKGSDGTWTITHAIEVS